jgi:hypothetical protein
MEGRMRGCPAEASLRALFKIYAIAFWYRICLMARVPKTGLKPARTTTSAVKTGAPRLKNDTNTII